MAETLTLQATTAGLPWSREQGERRRYAAISLLVTVLFLPPAVLIPTVELPEPERAEVEKIPPQLARLVQAPKPRPEPAPEPVLPEPPESPEPTTQPEPPKPEPKPIAKVAKPAPERRPPPAPTQTVEQARETAARSGLLAMRDRLATLRAPTRTPTAALTANTTDASAATVRQPTPEAVLAGSGGVDQMAAPDVEVAVAGHEVKTVEVSEAPATQVASAPVTRAPAVGERPMSNIRKVFDAQKTALYSLYKRELRQDPTLEGKVLLELVIEPDGSVSACQVVSSELDNPALEQRIAMRVRLFNFGAADVAQRTVRFPIDFLPG